MSFPDSPTLPTVISGVDVEQAVEDTLKLRLPYYIEQDGLAPIKSWMRISEFAKFPEDRVPMIITICPGLAEPPSRQGDGTYIARWLVGVAVVASARDGEGSRQISRRIGSLIRATLLQSPSLTPKGFARGVTWLDESYDQLDPRLRRTLTSAEETFNIEVGGVVNAQELPWMPAMTEMPTPTGYEADEVDLDVHPMEVE